MCLVLCEKHPNLKTRKLIQIVNFKVKIKVLSLKLKLKFLFKVRIKVLI
jgi:hypothetical protein